jgi:hypothetical protein
MKTNRDYEARAYLDYRRKHQEGDPTVKTIEHDGLRYVLVYLKACKVEDVWIYRILNNEKLKKIKRTSQSLLRAIDGVIYE